LDRLKDWALGIASKASKVSITERQNGDVMILDLDGNILTGASAAAVRGVIRRLLAAEHRKIFLNMAQVRWVDSLGIGELVAAHVAVARAGGQIKLLKVRPNIKTLLTATRLDTVLAIYDAKLAALNDYL
jgi:anti-sigma B factor antagonist